MTNVYITKDALTTGPALVEIGRIDEDRFAIIYRPVFSCYAPSAYRLTWAEARADCEARRAKKIASLKKQIAKLEALTFVEPTEVAK